MGSPGAPISRPISTEVPAAATIVVSALLFVHRDHVLNNFARDSTERLISEPTPFHMLPSTAQTMFPHF